MLAADFQDGLVDMDLLALHQKTQVTRFLPIKQSNQSISINQSINQNQSSNLNNLINMSGQWRKW
jgi:hypothetical protein